jgi:hypothetical protein
MKSDVDGVLTGSMIAGAALRVAATKGEARSSSARPEHDDDALVEIMAIAAAAAQGWRWYDFKQMIDVQDGAVCSRNRHSWRVSCRAALNALREHGKENA